MTQAKHAVTGRGIFAVGAVASLLTVSGVILAPIAAGQEPALIAKLKSNVKCLQGNAAKQLMRNAASSGAKLPVLLAALDELSIDRQTCAEIKDAASELALDLANDDPAPTTAAPQAEAEPAAESQPDDIAAAAAQRMQQVLVEADRSAASMRFEVGPPPRNLTRSRAAPS